MSWLINLRFSDIDAQIKRCYERIEENIMPHIFKDKLEEYKKRRVKKQYVRFKFILGEYLFTRSLEN